MTKEATCTVDGSKEKVCSVCEDKVTEVIPAAGHKWNEEYTIDKEASCTEEGSKSIHCSVCNAIDETTVTVIPKTDHTYGEWKVTKEATCTEDGSKEKACSACENKVTEVIPATGHKWNEEYTVDKDATCTEEGSKSIHCSVCKAVDETTVTVIPKTDHTYGEWKVTKEATCTEDGSKEKACSACENKVTEVIPATGHKWNEEYTIDKEASCSEEGSESIHCSVCDKVKENSAKAIEKKDHEYGDWKTVKEATTTSTGLKERKCKNCDAIEQEEIAKIVPPAPSVPTVIPAEISPSNPVAAASVDKQITTAKSDADPKGSVFNLLQAKGVAKSKTSVKVSWTRVTGASSYIIYGNKCGAGNQFKKIATVTGTSYTQKKLKKGTYYKYLIVAVNGEKALSTSKTIHVATKGGKVGNSKSITTKAKKNKVSLKKGKTFKLGAKAVAQSKKLKVKKHRAIAYESSNKKIATVSGKGVIKAVGKGTCYVFAYAQNGVCKKIIVTVK